MVRKPKARAFTSLGDIPVCGMLNLIPWEERGTVNKLENLEKLEKEENQDGGVGRHTAPPRTTRTDRKSNGKEVQHQVDKKETDIQTGRRGRDGHWGGENSRGHGGTETGGVWDERDRQSDH